MAEAPRDLTYLQFDSVRDMLDYLSNEIARMKTLLGDLLRIVEEDKAKADIMNQLEQVFSELANRPIRPQEAEFELGGIRVIVNPTPKSELDILLDVLRSVQQKVVHLERAKKSLEPLSKIEAVGIKVTLIMEGGVPRHVLIKIPTA